MSEAIELDFRPAPGPAPEGETTTPEIAVVTIRRPERRNALDTAACRALSAALAEAAGRPARALVLTGSEGSFCAGADLGTVRDAEFGPALRSVLQGLVDLPVVCLAAVEGPALGAGVQLAVSCDLRVVGERALFGVPAGRLGLMVDHWTVRRVSLVAGDSLARSMLVGGVQATGEEALAAGFAQRGGGLDGALEWAGQIARLAPLTLAGHKLALNRVEEPAGDPLVEEARRRAWSSSDLEEGMAAFRDRRPPSFRGT